MYDEIPIDELEKTFDRVKFYNELQVGITLQDFIAEKRLKPFVAVATYDSNISKDRNNEFVSLVEGTYMPFFGFAHRIDQV